MRRKIYLSGLLASLSLVTILWAQMPVPTQTDFEGAEGYSPGPLTPDTQWDPADTGAAVTDQDSSSGQQSILFPGTNSSFLSGSYLNDFPDEITFLDFYLRPVTGPLESLPLEPGAPPTALMVGFVEDASGGSFYVTDGDGQSGGVWLPVAEAFAVTSNKTDDWVRLTYRINYAAKTWDFYLDETMVAADLGFLDNVLDRFSSLNLRGGNQGLAGFDFYYVGFTNPLFVDEDKDGVDDAYEQANAMNVNLDDRLGDADRDTLSNLEEYVAGLQAGNPDSDDDGRHDGMDANPGVADSYALSAIPFAEDFEGMSLGAIDGLNLWQASAPGASVQNEVAAQGAQSLAVSSGAVDLEVSNDFDGSDDSTIWLRFQLKPTWWEATTYPQSADLSANSAAVFFFQEGGRVVGFNGNGGQWSTVDLGLDEDAWLDVVLFEDYAAQTWSLWVNGAPAFTGMGFRHQQPYFHRFALKQINSKPTYLDNFSARYTDSIDVDSDFDGLLDSEEDINGNGLVDLGETDPHNADTDGDGINDQAGILMRLWLRADTGVTTDVNGQVTSWSDARGTGDVMQVDANLQPQLVADVLAGEPAVRFDGVDDFLAGLSDFDPTDEDFTFLIVQQKSGGHDKAAPLSYNVGAVSGAPLIRWGPELGQLGINDVDVGPAGLYVELGPDHENKPYVATFCRSADELCVRALGPGQTERATGTQTWVSGGDGHFYLGKKKDSADHFFGGDILEVRVYQGALSEADLLQLESELAARYGVEIDLDDDGLLDSFERLHFGDLDEVGSGDFDNDGVNNLREQNLGLDPLVADAPEGVLGDPNLQLWLRADSGLTADADGKVLSWEDVSGNGGVAYQGGADQQPTLVSNVLSGEPAVVFDGVDDYLEALSELNASASDFTIIAVHNRTGGHDKAAVLSYSTSAEATGAPLLRWGPNPGQFGINDVGVSAAGVYTDPGANFAGQSYVSTVTRSGGVNGLNGTLFLRNSGNGATLESTGPQTWTSEDTGALYLGRKKVAEDHYLGGSIAEVLVFDSALTPAEIALIEADLIALYGVDADLDGDGLSDAWEQTYFGSLDVDGSLDSDGDGVSDLREFNLGTNPNADDSFHFIMKRDDLQFWLSAGQGVELDEQGGVMVWRDQSGLGRDAVQGSQSNRPGWISSNAQHQPALVFDGVNDYLNGLAGFDPAASDYTVVLVHNKTGGHDKAAPISFSTGSSDNGAPLLRWGPNAGQLGINNVGVNADGVYIDLSATDASNVLLSTVRSENDYLTLTTSREGESYEASGPRTWSAQSSAGYFLGKKTGSNNTHMLGGEIAEVIVFNSALSDEELAAVEAYLTAQYGLSNDSDQDGLTNDQEDLNANGLVDAGETDPWNPDTDNDGIADSLDFEFEADPTNPVHVAQLTDVDGYLTWSTSFETSEGITTGPLGGQDSWTASRITQVTDADASEGTQSLSLTPPTVDGVSSAERLIDGSSAPQIWVSFDAKLAAGRLPRPSEINDSAAALFALTYSDTVAAYDITTQRWLYAQGAASAGQWAHFDVYLDYEEKTWKLFVDGEFIFENLPLLDDTRTALERFKAWQSGQGAAGLVDNLIITNKVPAGDIDGDGLSNELEVQLGSNIFEPDSDGDTMLDGWEYTFGLQITVADGDQDQDDDGLLNAEEYAYGGNPLLADTDDDGYNDLVEAKLLKTSISEFDNAADFVALTDFTLSDIGATGSHAYQSGNEENVYYLGGYGTGFITETNDSGHMLQQSVTGNFSVAFRLDSLEGETEDSNILLMARTNTDEGAPFAGVRSRENRRYFYNMSRLNENQQYGEELLQLSKALQQRWIRMVREGNRFHTYASEDGESWIPLGSQTVSLPDEVLLGLFYASGDDSQFLGIKTTIVEWLTDADRDGLWDSEELLLGTLINDSDSDDDGFSDYDEVHKLFSDPLVPDAFYVSAPLETQNGASATITSGQWRTDGDVIIARDYRGALEYALNIPEAGYYRIDVVIREGNSLRDLSQFEMNAAVDGFSLGDETAFASPSQPAILSYWLPWSAAGSRQLKLDWIPIDRGASLQIDSINLVRLEFADQETKDVWEANQVDSQVSLGNAATITSPTSPYCLYGEAWDLSLLTIEADSSVDPVVANRALTRTFYADVPLLPMDGATQVSASSHGGAFQAEQSVTWEMTNFVNPPAVDVIYLAPESALLVGWQDELAGDAPMGVWVDVFRVTSSDDGLPETVESQAYWDYSESPVTAQELSNLLSSAMETSWDAVIPAVHDYATGDERVFANAQTRVVDDFSAAPSGLLRVDGFGLDAGEVASVRFSADEQYLIRASWRDVNGEAMETIVPVDVVSVELGGATSLATGYSRLWEPPSFNDEAVLSGDPQLSLVPAVAGETGAWNVSTASTQSQRAIARLGNEGPVLDVVDFPVFTVYNHLYTGTLRVLDRFSDGSQLVEFTIALGGDIPEDLEIRLNIISPGVLFDDGLIEKTVTTDDLDELGRYRYRLVIPADIPSNGCHGYTFYEGGEPLTTHQ